ncbi:putative PC-Esterase [Lupinus albus]|uniref:Putative PC-Esterase n=1 Tax=Lupinus albus TaxID=3870 RepID=A0A6A4NSF5_LUPAL|nr:putative PC-Esterase [Lupinus albus]
MPNLSVSDLLPNSLSLSKFIIFFVIIHMLIENAKAIWREPLDVTKLALLRPDAHPRAYINHFPYANDCVHWCLPLPGPINTLNENGKAKELRESKNGLWMWLSI